MTTPSLASDPNTAKAAQPTPRYTLARAGAVLGLPLVLYLAVRPVLGSDTAALAVAGAAPLLYDVALVAVRRRVDPLGVLAAIGYALGCAVSVLMGGSSLPLKLHEAAVTIVVGLALLIAVAVRRPLPVARLLRVPCPSTQVDTSLSVMIGAFLLLHALAHVALAVSLSTIDYLVVARIVNWATIAIGALSLSAYLRRAARSQVLAPGHSRRPSTDLEAGSSGPACEASTRHRVSG
jgi:hypothetical protein